MTSINKDLKLNSKVEFLGRCKGLWHQLWWGLCIFLQVSWRAEANRWRSRATQQRTWLRSQISLSYTVKYRQ